MTNKTQTSRLNIGAILFPKMDQIDFAGPFEVLSQLPDSTFHVLAKENKPIRDVRGLILTPEKSLAEAPPLDLLVVPGGVGQIALMEDDEVLGFIRAHADAGKLILSVCTGALTCGAAGLLKGRRATTHWASFNLLKYFGAIPVNERVVIDGQIVSAAGVTAGIDGALRVAAMLRGDRVAQGIELYLEYAPEPPFRTGRPDIAPAEVVAEKRAAAREVLETRTAIARRIAAKLRVAVNE
jgi:cyclohexyl-isocyanide hydratase